MGLSNTQRTLKELRDQGLPCQIVEQFVKRANMGHGIRRDLFGIIDIIAVGGPARRIIGIQSTGVSFSEHKKKILEEKPQEALDWLKAGGQLWLWGWYKKKVKRGGKAEVWAYKEYKFTLADFEVEQEFDPFA